MDDWRLKFGKISPSVFIHGAEFRKMLPEGGDMCVVTTNVENYDADHLEAAREEAKQAIRRLDNREVDCIVAGGTPIYALDSHAEAAFISDLEASLQCPLTTSLSAQVDALDALGAASLLVVTPYPEERDRDRKEYLEGNGFEVVEIGGISEQTVAEAVSRDPTDFYTIAHDLAHEHGEAFDAIYIPCAALRIVDYIEPLEEDTGRPVVTSAQAQVWKAFEATGINPPLSGYGRLFEQLG